MVRRFGSAILLVAVLIAAQRIFMPFDFQVGSRFDGEEVVAVTERCGRAALVLMSPDTEMTSLGPSVAADCTRAARTRALEAGGALALGVAGFWFTRSGRLANAQPMDEALRPLPTVDGEVYGRRRDWDDDS